jgi:cytochrome b6
MAKSQIPADVETHLPAGETITGKVARYLLERYPVWPIISYLLDKKVPQHKHSIWYNMGGIALFFLTVQFVTGILLMVYYRPGEPWGSVQRIVMEVPFGAFIRSIHHWSANLMVLTIFVHLFSTFFMKAYRPPREFTWLTGASLAGITLLFGFSGYLLPWDDLSFFATRVGISEVAKAPFVGEWLATLIQGGPDVTIDTIGRFYVLHVVALPLTVLSVIGVHLFFIQLQGVSEPDSFAYLPKEKKRYHKYFSEFLFAEVPIWLLLSALLIALSAIFPRELAMEAEPSASAPVGIKPEWYFLSQFQLLKLFPGRIELLGLMLLGLIPLSLVVLPFIDRTVPVDSRGRLVTKLGIAAVIGLVALTVWGWLS